MSGTHQYVSRIEYHFFYLFMQFILKVFLDDGSSVQSGIRSYRFSVVNGSVEHYSILFMYLIESLNEIQLPFCLLVSDVGIIISCFHLDNRCTISFYALRYGPVTNIMSF